MVEKPLDISSEVKKLLKPSDPSRKRSQVDDDECLRELSKLYESEGTVNELVNAQLALLLTRW